DGTALAGLADDSCATLGGQPIIVKDGAARLADGTLAGSTTTMDRAFRLLVGPVGLSPVTAAILCSTTPARALGLADLGVLAVGARADLVVLDRHLRVAHTFVDGVHVFGDEGVNQDLTPR
ncbi:MAG: amidohydrolase family protein, partial [Acidimicrobiia bacterium]